MRKVAWISLALLVSIMTYGTIMGVYTEAPNRAFLEIPNLSNQFQASYTVRGPIFIDTESDFASYGFPGTGDKDTPYRIEDYSITTGSTELIVIENVECYFVIQGNYLDSVSSSLDAIYIRNAKCGTVYNNMIVNNRHGVFIDTGCQSMNITNNVVWDSSQSGIRVNGSSDIRVYENEVHDNTYNGIWASYSAYVDIRNNTVYDDELGIWLRDSSSSHVIGNTLFGNDNAMWMSNNSNSNDIMFNRVFGPAASDPNTCGIHLSHGAYGNSILNNTVANSTEHGFYVEATSGNNTIKWNTFIGNNIGGTSQAFDAVSIDVLYNYWSDWTTPDEDLDQIVDIPYSLEGPAMNDDPYPLTFPATPPEFHYLTPVTVLYPNGGESITDTVTIQWTSCYDSEFHAVNYSVYSSHNFGADWKKIADNLSGSQFEWDASAEVKTTHYLIRVVATCSNGLTQSDTSDGEFSLVAHSLSEFTITSPTSPGPFDASLEIEWSAAVDSWEYIVSYSVQYSSNAGYSWTVLASGLTSTSYEWALLGIQSGASCVVKVIASVDGGLTSEAVSVTFSIEHVTTSTTTTTVAGPDLTLPLAGVGIGAAAVIITILLLVRRRSPGGT